MGPRIVRLKGQSGVGKLVRAREVARAVVTPALVTRSFKAIAKSSIADSFFGSRASARSAEVYDLAVDRLIAE